MLHKPCVPLDWLFTACKCERIHNPSASCILEFIIQNMLSIISSGTPYYFSGHTPPPSLAPPPPSPTTSLLLLHVCVVLPARAYKLTVSMMQPGHLLLPLMRRRSSGKHLLTAVLYEICVVHSPPHKPSPYTQTATRIHTKALSSTVAWKLSFLHPDHKHAFTNKNAKYTQNPHTDSYAYVHSCTHTLFSLSLVMHR